MKPKKNSVRFMLMKQRLTTIEAERIKFDKSKREQLIDVSTFGK